MHVKFHDDQFRHSSNIKGINSIREAAVMVLLMIGIYEVRFWNGSGGVIYIPSFMTFGSGIQVILSLLPQQSERLECWYYW
jgi:UDP-N-acetylmuramyl pentapeptide phosphotransferase/UDP-N-acetylglucosamine-1-phosphate transferase